MDYDNITKDDIAFGLSGVILNEQNEPFELSFEEIGEVQSVCKKIVNALDKEDLRILAKIRTDTFVSSIEQKKAIDMIFNETQS